MADAQRTIDLIFNGVDKTGAAVQSVISGTSNLAGNIQGATQPIADFTSGAVKLEAALIAGGAALTGFAVKAAGDFDSSFREISTLIDAPADSLDRFKQAILDYASGSTAPLEEVTGALYNAISAGVDFGDAIQAVSDAERLSVAGRADLNDSLVVLVSSLNAYGLSMDEAGRFSDALFTTVRQGQTTLPELAASLSQVTGTAATLDVPFETLLAAIAALTSTGTPTTQAVSQINAALAALIKPSEQASKLAAELGIEFDAQAVKARGLDGVLQDVASATGGNEEQMGRLFGSVEALRAVFPLTGKAAETFSDNLAGMADNAGATQAAFDKMAGSLDQSTQIIQNALRGIFIQIGDPLLDDVGGIADAIAQIFQTLGASLDSGQLAEIVGFIEGQFEALESTLQAVAGNLAAALDQADLSGFVDGLRAVSEALGGIFDGADLTTVEGLAQALTGLADGFELLSGFTAGVIDSLGPLLRTIGEIAVGVTELSPEFVKAAGEMGGFATQANLLSGALVDMLPAVEGLVAIIGVRQGAGLVGSLGSAASALSGSSGLLALLGKAGLVGAAGTAGYALGTLLDKTVELATGTSLSDRLTEWVVSASGASEELQGLTDELDRMRDTNQTIKAIRDADDAMAGLAGTAEDGQERVYNFSAGLWEVADAAEEGVGTLVPYKETLYEAADAADAAAGKGDDLGKSVKGIEDETKKLSLDEKLAAIAAQSQIMVAQIQADATRISSAFDAISASFVSTGDTLQGLFDLLGDENISKLDKLGIKEQITAEEERRDKLLERQLKLTDAEIKVANARAKAFESGDAMINIDGAGLQPHLEAFMWEILTAIQVRVNQDGYEYLLGSP